jgi:hypothetical protein
MKARGNDKWYSLKFFQVVFDRLCFKIIASGFYEIERENEHSVCQCNSMFSFTYNVISPNDSLAAHALTERDSRIEFADKSSNDPSPHVSFNAITELIPPEPNFVERRTTARRMKSVSQSRSPISRKPRTGILK